MANILELLKRARIPSKEKIAGVFPALKVIVDAYLANLQRQRKEGEASEAPPFMGVKDQRFISSAQTPTPVAVLTPVSNKATQEELIRAIVEASGEDPVATMAAQIVREGQQYPVFQENPFLPVAIAQLESRGFKDFGVNPLVVLPKQGFGYGVNISSYNPPIEMVLSDLLSAIGSEREGESPERRRNVSYYQSFRENPSDIVEFARQYAGPVTSQNPNAGEIYASNLKTVMNKYAEALDKILRQRGAEYSKRY